MFPRLLLPAHALPSAASRFAGLLEDLNAPAIICLASLIEDIIIYRSPHMRRFTTRYAVPPTTYSPPSMI